MAREHQDAYVWEGARENARGHAGSVGVPEAFGYTDVHWWLPPHRMSSSPVPPPRTLTSAPPNGGDDKVSPFVTCASRLGRCPQDSPLPWARGRGL